MEARRRGYAAKIFELKMGNSQREKYTLIYDLWDLAQAGIGTILKPLLFSETLPVLRRKSPNAETQIGLLLYSC